MKSKKAIKEIKEIKVRSVRKKVENDDECLIGIIDSIRLRMRKINNSIAEIVEWKKSFIEWQKDVLPQEIRVEMMHRNTYLEGKYSQDRDERAQRLEGVIVSLDFRIKRLEEFLRRRYKEREDELLVELYDKSK